MRLQDAFLGKSALPGSEVPLLHATDYSNNAMQWGEDARSVVSWLLKKGLSEKDINSRTIQEWSRLKTQYFDQGEIPPSFQHTAPTLDSEWARVGEDYKIPPDQVSNLESAWKSFAKNGFTDETGRIVGMKSEGVSRIFDNFVRAFRQEKVALEPTLDGVRSDLDELDKITLDTLDLRTDGDIQTEIQEAVDTVSSYVDGHFTRQDYDDWADKAYREVMSVYETGLSLEDQDMTNFIDQYIAEEESRLSAPAEPLDIGEERRSRPEIPPEIQEEIKRAQLLGNEELRRMIWEKPDASNFELLRELQQIPEGVSVEHYVASKYNGASVESQYKHVFEIWEMERDLGQAIETLKQRLPNAGDVIERLESRVSEIQHTESAADLEDMQDFIRSEGGLRFEDDPDFVDLGPLEAERIPSVDIDLSEYGHGTARVLGLSEEDYQVNAEIIQDSIAAAAREGTLLDFIRASPTGDLFLNLGEMAVGAVGGSMLGSALHNTTEMDLLSLAMAAVDPVSGFLGVLPSLGNSLIDWADRQQAFWHPTDKPRSMLMFVRQGDKWVPALARNIEQPNEFDSPVDFVGGLNRRKGVMKVSFVTGYGLKKGYSEYSADLDWIRKGKRGSILIRDSDIGAGNQEAWKPWLNYYFPTAEDTVEYLKTGAFAPRQAAELNPIYKELNSSPEFEALVELSHAMFNSHTVDPDYAATLKKGHWSLANPDTFSGVRDWHGWYNATVADLLSWEFEDDNPDNWWQTNMLHSTDTQDYVNRVAKQIVDMMDKHYESLTDKTELIHSQVEEVPTSALDLQESLRDIKSDRSLSEEARAFRVNQETTRFWLRQINTINDEKPDEFEEAAGSGLMSFYKQAQISYADYMPEQFIQGGTSQIKDRSLLLGEAVGQFGKSWRNTNQWGIEDYRPPLQKMPSIHKADRAFVQTANDSRVQIHKQVMKSAPPPTILHDATQTHVLAQ